MYRVTVIGREKIPKQGAGIIVCNHVSDVDALIIMGASIRPIRFVMDKSVSERPLLKSVFCHAGVIPICSPKQSETSYNQAFELIHEALFNNELVCIFPEGRVTSDGTLGEFYVDIDKILARDSVPVIPMALDGLWGSYFSHKDGLALTTIPIRFRSRVSVTLAEAIDGHVANKDSLRVKIASLLGK